MSSCFSIEQLEAELAVAIARAEAAEIETSAIAAEALAFNEQAAGQINDLRAKLVAAEKAATDGFVSLRKAWTAAADEEERRETAEAEAATLRAKLATAKATHKELSERQHAVFAEVCNKLSAERAAFAEGQRLWDVLKAAHEVALADNAPLKVAGAEALVATCSCVECDEPGVRYFRTEGDGPFWLCGSKDQKHAMPERYAGEEVEAGSRPLDALRAALAAPHPGQALLEAVRLAFAAAYEVQGATDADVEAVDHVLNALRPWAGKPT